MTKVRDLLVAAAAIAIIMQSAASTGVARTVAQAAQDVFVTNTAAKPVPVAVQGTATVRVTNAATRPVWVRDVNEARQPFQRQLTLRFLGDQNEAFSEQVTVPSGKRLVIEQVSAYGIVGKPKRLTWIGIRTVVNGEGVNHAFPLTRHDWSTSNYAYGANNQVRIYAAPSTKVQALSTRESSDSGAAILVSISGYYVNVP